jgi:hypothetical protein
MCLKNSRENQANGSEGAFNGFKRETEITRNMELIQEVPLGSYHEALALTRNTYTIIRTILVDYRKQLIQARDLWVRKGDDVPTHVQEAIRHLDDVLFHFAGRDNPSQEEVESEDDAIPGTGSEGEVPSPGAVAFEALVRLVGGDVEAANRLIEYERSQFPNDPPDNLIERAIDRLVHDRQG